MTPRPSMLRPLAALALWIAVAMPASALDFPEHTGAVVDEAHMLDAPTRAALTRKLADLEARTTDQLVVVTLASLRNTTIESYAVALGEHWALGQPGQSNSALLIIAPSAGKVALQVSAGLQEKLTNEAMTRIINQVLVPRLHANDISGGLGQGVDAIAAVLIAAAAGAALPAAPPPAAVSAAPPPATLPANPQVPVNPQVPAATPANPQVAQVPSNPPVPAATPAAVAAPPTSSGFPALTGRVVDAANILSGDIRDDLTAKLAALEAKTTDQLVVVTVQSLGGQSIEEFGVALGRAWALGQKGRDNGVVLIVAPAEREVRIEVGYGLEGTLTDAVARLIIEMAIVPRFRTGDFPGGISRGVDDIIQVLSGDAEDFKQRAAPPRSRTASDYIILVCLISIGSFLVLNTIFGGLRLLQAALTSLGWVPKRPRQGFWYWLDRMPAASGSSSRDRTSDSSSSSSSSSSGVSGGGGSFGGGGASGSW